MALKSKDTFRQVSLGDSKLFSPWRFTTHFIISKDSPSPAVKISSVILFTLVFLKIFFLLHRRKDFSSILLDYVTGACELNPATDRLIGEIHTHFNIFTCTKTSQNRSEKLKEVDRPGTSVSF